jgi:predicted esterase
MALSGYLPLPVPVEKRVNLSTPWIMCHGHADGVVPMQFAKDSFETIQGEYGLAGTFLSYQRMAHELNQEEFDDVLKFLLAQLPKSQ